MVKQALRDKESNDIKEETTTDTVKIFIDLKFSSNTIVKNCIKKLYKCFKKEVTAKFVLYYQTAKLSYFTNTKDKTLFLSQWSVTYKFVCPGCKSCYVGKTNRTLHERTKKHACVKGNKNEQSAIYEHLSLCTITAILQIYSRLTPIALIATSSTYRK